MGSDDTRGQDWALKKRAEAIIHFFDRDNDLSVMRRRTHETVGRSVKRCGYFGSGFQRKTKS